MRIGQEWRAFSLVLFYRRAKGRTRAFNTTITAMTLTAAIPINLNRERTLVTVYFSKLPRHAS